jgi:hypothetical protein
MVMMDSGSYWYQKIPWDFHSLFNVSFWRYDLKHNHKHVPFDGENLPWSCGQDAFVGNPPSVGLMIAKKGEYI